MTVLTRYVHIQTRRDGGMKDITSEVQGIIDESRIKEGMALIFCPGSTGAISTVEYEPGLQQDVSDALDRIAPRNGEYAHHEAWNDDNGSSHIKATLVGPSLSVPFTAGKLTLGTWQQIVFLECDTRDRQRSLIVQLSGE